MHTSNCSLSCVTAVSAARRLLGLNNASHGERLIEIRGSSNFVRIKRGFDLRWNVIWDEDGIVNDLRIMPHRQDYLETLARMLRQLGFRSGLRDSQFCLKHIWEMQ